MQQERFDPRVGLVHPVFVLALVALGLNDHVLKASAVLPLLSGKLSDVAGLLVAPLALSWLLRVRTRRGFAMTHLAVALGFALLQVPSVVEVLAEELRGLPLRVWPDPTDLLALPALGVSYGLFSRPRRRDDPRRLAPLTGGLALLLCTATTGGGSPPPRYPFPPAGLLQTDAFVRNPSSSDLLIDVRRLRDEVDVDCDALLDDPEEVLEEGNFLPVEEWTLARGDAVPLWDRRAGALDRECYAVRLRARGHQWYVVWRHGAPEMREIDIRLEPHQAPEAFAIQIANEGSEPPRVPEGVTVQPIP